MTVIEEINALRHILSSIKGKQKIAFVPTMGNLHKGHLELISKAKALADYVVVSIFVNPLQFGPNEDFATYPRTLSNDINKLEKLKVDSLFTPSTQEIYQDQTQHTKVYVPTISDEYCGRFRPTFFYGVTTIVAKLFNIVQPDIAIFGEKDFQQLYIIKKMVRDLAFPIEVISLPTVREQDGLAMSSRNQYLTEEERRQAVEIFNTLCFVRDKLLNGTRTYSSLQKAAIDHLTQNNFKVDYFTICNKENLEIATQEDQELIILIAAWLGETRLIDNLSISLG